jgi:hypothetical protein
MPKVTLESGTLIATVDGAPVPGSEIAIRGGPHEGIYVVLRQRWTVPRDLMGTCTEIVVRPSGEVFHELERKCG